MIFFLLLPLSLTCLLFWFKLLSYVCHKICHCYNNSNSFLDMLSLNPVLGGVMVNLIYNDVLCFSRVFAAHAVSTHNTVMAVNCHGKVWSVSSLVTILPSSLLISTMNKWNVRRKSSTTSQWRIYDRMKHWVYLSVLRHLLRGEICTFRRLCQSTALSRIEKSVFK